MIGARASSRYEELFTKSLDVLVEGMSSLGVSNCVLDIVENGNSFTLEETGDILNITRERVRQIESKALLRIKGNSDDDMESWEERN